ncbi:helix-turn-helix domain-containing protein [Rhodococcus sp. A14]|uniref:helix-turn-helix domain-containing protein n=1 Tax=Rhodococcus sp. A14 TaxID=1194106 RepID=UPI00141DCFED|nr:hypothetical protein [Rhodococcus sp. A14]
MSNNAKCGDGEPTASSLLANAALGLRLVVPAPGLQRVLVGHHTTDLVHPARYLFPGELLLTNGLWLAHRPAHEWITDVKSAGSPAVAFGLNEMYPTVPPSVIIACTELDMALIAVSTDVSFSKIAEAIDTARAPVDSARQQLDHLRRLRQELAGCSAQAELIMLLNRETGLRCWLVGSGGRCLAGTGPPPDQEILRVAARIGRHGHLSGALSGGLCSFTVGWWPQANLSLVFDSELKDISDEARLVIETVMPNFLIEHAERRARAGMRGALVRELLELIWTGNIASAAFVARMRAMDFDPHAPLMVIASANDLFDIADAVDGCSAQCVFTRHNDVNVMIVQTNSDRAVDEIADIIREGGREPILGAGSPGLGAEGLRRSLAQALPACRIALSRRSGDRVIRQFDVGSYAGLLHFVDHQTLSAFKDALLGPLVAWDREHDADLVVSLQLFLENDGKWRQTARELHIHHNTLKYRMQRISELTGRDPEQMGSRIDFALALAIPGALGS